MHRTRGPGLSCMLVVDPLMPLRLVLPLCACLLLDCGVCFKVFIMESLQNIATIYMFLLHISDFDVLADRYRNLLNRN